MLFTWDTTNLCIVFRQWHVRSSTSLVFSLFAVILLSMGYEALRAVSRRYEASLTHQVDSLPSKFPPAPFPPCLSNLYPLYSPYPVYLVFRVAASAHAAHVWVPFADVPVLKVLLSEVMDLLLRLRLSSRQGSTRNRRTTAPTSSRPPSTACRTFTPSC